MKVKDHRQMMRSLTDPLNIPKLRTLIETHPVLTQEEFRTRQNMAKGGTPQLVQPGPPGVRPGYQGPDKANLKRLKKVETFFENNPKVDYDKVTKKLTDLGYSSPHKQLNKLKKKGFLDEVEIVKGKGWRFIDVDIDTIESYRNDGWTTQEIADELKVSKAKIERAVKEAELGPAQLLDETRLNEKYADILKEKKIKGKFSEITDNKIKNQIKSLYYSRHVNPREKTGFVKTKEAIETQFKNLSKFAESGQTLDDFYDIFKDQKQFKKNLRAYLKGEASPNVAAEFDKLDFKTKYKNVIPKIEEHLEVWHEYEKNPGSTYKGKLKKEKIKRWSDLHTENMISKAKRVKKTDYDNILDLAHRQDLVIDQNVSELGIERPEINRVLIKDAELERNKLHRKNFSLVDDIKKGYNVEKNLQLIKENNARITKIAEITNGRLTGITINPDTLETVKLKPSNIMGVDAGILNKSMKDLNVADKKVLRTQILPQIIEEARAMTPEKMAADLSALMEDEALSKKLATRMKNLKTGKQITKPVFDKSHAVYKIMQAYQANGIGKGCPIGKAEGGRIGFAKAGIVDDKCMRNAINEHKRKLGDGNEAAIKKQMKINQTKGLKNMFTMGRRGLQSIISGVGLNHPGALALEAAIEAGFYGYGRQQGESHEQARENLFFPKILAKYVPDLWEKFGGKPFKTGVWEGPEKLIEEELLAENESAQEYAQGMKALEDEYANASKIDFELGILNNQWRPGSEEQIEAKKQELKDSYDRIEELQINIKEGTPIHDAYVAAQEKQKALQDKRAQDYYGDSPAYKGSKQRQWQKEFLDYRGADRKYRKEQPFAFKGGIEDAIVKPGTRIDWDAYADYGWDKPEQKWKDIYDVGGWDLMDRIGIAGGISKMSKGGRASYLDGGIVSLLKK
jgi:hypothetical protein